MIRENTPTYISSIQGRATEITGPYLAILEDGTGTRLLPYEGKIKVMNRLGADGWIIDTFHYSGDGGNIVSHIGTLAMTVEGVGRVGNYSVKVIRRRARDY